MSRSFAAYFYVACFLQPNTQRDRQIVPPASLKGRSTPKAFARRETGGGAFPGAALVVQVARLRHWVSRAVPPYLRKSGREMASVPQSDGKGALTRLVVLARAPVHGRRAGRAAEARRLAEARAALEARAAPRAGLPAAAPVDGRRAAAPRPRHVLAEARAAVRVPVAVCAAPVSRRRRGRREEAPVTRRFGKGRAGHGGAAGDAPTLGFLHAARRDWSPVTAGGFSRAASPVIVITTPMSLSSPDLVAGIAKAQEAAANTRSFMVG